MYKDWVYHTLLTVATILTFLFVAAVVFPVVVFAEPASPNAVPDMGGFWDAIGSAHWPLAIGIGLTILVWLVRTFVIHKIPKHALPWVTLGLAIVSAAGTRMVLAIQDDVAWWQGLIRGVLEGATVGFAAIGWWDLKQSARKREDPPLSATVPESVSEPPQKE